MFKRAVRIGLSFTIVAIAYGSYALIVVPLIEPRVQAKASGEITEKDKQRLGIRIHRHDGLWGKLFPEGAWEREGPKVLESEQAMLLLDEHRQIDENRLELVPCTMILFPKPRERAGGAPQGTPLVLRAKEGAELEFDGPFDLSRGSIGRLVGGRLRGEVIIFRQPSAPGADDDLEVVTRDVQLDSQRIETPHDVRFRFGRSYGNGRNLIISLLPSEDGASSHGPAIGGIKSLELVQVEKVHLTFAGRGLLPGLDAPDKQGDGKVTVQPTAGSVVQAAAQVAGGGRFGASDPPIEITCDGPFFFDAVRRVARFEQHVDVIRLNPDGPSDQLNCELLEIKFTGDAAADERPAGKPPGRPPAAKSGRRGTPPGNQQLSNLKPAHIIASGRPVMVRSPSNDAWAQSETLSYDITSRQLRLQGENLVILRHGPHEVQAPAIQYQPLPKTQLGQVWASGPGQFRGTLGEEKTETLEAKWQKELQLRPHQGQHVLTLLGAASVEFTEAGKIAADAIHLWMKEVEPSADAEGQVPVSQPAVAGSERIQPQRMQAKGQVEIDSPRLTGRTNQLEIWIEHPPPAPRQVAAVAPRAQPAGQTAPARPGPPRPRPAAGRRPEPAATRPAAPGVPGLGALFDGGDPQQSAQQFDIVADLLRVRLVRQGPTTSVRNVAAEGSVRLLETKTAQPGELPLEVTGQRAEVEDASEPRAKVSIVGTPAHVQGRGISAEGGDIRLDRGENRLQIEGPGRMQLPIDKTPAGRPLARPQKLNVAWNQGMDFDGRTAQFNGQVSAATDSQRALAETMEVTLSKQIDFARSQQRDKVDVREIQLDGGVWLENVTVEQGSQVSVDRLEVRNLHINRISGDILADGPGWFTTVRRGEKKPAGQEAAAPAGPMGIGHFGGSGDGQLSYLRTDFLRGITGNLNRRELRFEEQVRTIYGPVEDWQQTIDADSPQGLSERDVLLNCDTLHLAQIGQAAEGPQPVEVTAQGNTVVESQRFWSRAHRITYVQAKDLLILEGDGRSDAQLWRQEQIGGDRTRAAARKILYWRGTNEIKIDDARYFDWTRSGGPARR